MHTHTPLEVQKQSFYLCYLSLAREYLYSLKHYMRGREEEEEEERRIAIHILAIDHAILAVLVIASCIPALIPLLPWLTKLPPPEWQIQCIPPLLLNGRTGKMQEDCEGRGVDHSTPLIPGELGVGQGRGQGQGQGLGN